MVAAATVEGDVKKIKLIKGDGDMSLRGCNKI